MSTTLGTLSVGAIALAVGVQGLALRPAEAHTYSVVHAFTGQLDGGDPLAGVTPDPAGNIYGVDQFGGSLKGGAVYKIDPSGLVTSLHEFDCATGCFPYIEPLTLVGATLYGGTAIGGEGASNGVLFSINTDGSAYTVLHEFGGKEGEYPTGALRLIAHHGFVGVTEFGGNVFSPSGAEGNGVLFSLNRFGRYRKLHDFADGADGAHPSAVVVDSAGAVYGSAAGGGGSCAGYGTYGCGVLFKFDLNTGQYSVLYRFTGGTDGAAPVLGSIGPDGTVYGITRNGTGVGYYGSVFSFKAATGMLTTLAYSSRTLGQPSTGPTITSSGKLVGATAFALYIYNFGPREVLQPLSSVATGEEAYGQPAIAANGSIVGTTLLGGDKTCNHSVSNESGCGVVYRYSEQ